MQPTSTGVPAEQEYPYGWRYVKRVQTDGSETLEQVALTLEDVLHPQEGDVIPENTDHNADCLYLFSVFRSRSLLPPVALVTHDLLVDWGVPGIRNHSPDIAVFVDLDHDPQPTGLLELSALGGRCELVVEVVSPSTRSNDVVAKVEHYHTVGVGLYVLIDQEKEGGPRTLRAYRRKPDRYVEVEADDKNRIDVRLLGLMIGMRDKRVVCWDLQTEQELGDYSRIVRQLEEADRRIEQQQQDYEDQVLARQQAERLAKEVQHEADRQREAAQRAQDEADRQRQEADNQREAAQRAQDEAANQRRAREEADRQRLAQEQLIRELQEKVRLLQSASGGDLTNPTA